jgi:hypothetical protein
VSQREITSSDIGSILFWGAFLALVVGVFVWLWLAQ